VFITRFDQIDRSMVASRAHEHSSRCMVHPMSTLDVINAFSKAMSETAERNSAAVKVITKALGVQHHPELEKDGPRGPRIETFHEDGSLKSSSPGELLPCSADNSPDTYNNVEEALNLMKADVLTGMYSHTPTLTLVLMTLSGQKVGVRLLALRGPRLFQLIKGLKEQADARGTS
jgi:hypothetical protein